MIVNLCPACRRINAAQAERCDACGADLSEWDTQPTPLRTLLMRDSLMQDSQPHAAQAGARSALRAGMPAGQPATPPAVSKAATERHALDHGPDTALWLDDLKANPGRAPRPAAQPELTQLDITLREIHLPSPFAGAAARRAQQARPAPPAPRVPDLPPLPTIDELALFDIAVPPQPAVAPVRRPAHAPLVADKAARAALKVARRGAVRRDRLQSTAAASAAAPDVLVLDADDTACHQMCSLLRGFGFGVRSTANVAEAFALATAQPFVAVFADVALDGSGGGIGLFQHVRGAAQRHGAGSTLLVLAAARLSHIDRVRAELAGCDEAITKPVSRGSVARVLDSHGVALPSDARRV